MEVTGTFSLLYSCNTSCIVDENNICAPKPKIHLYQYYNSIIGLLSIAQQILSLTNFAIAIVFAF